MRRGDQGKKRGEEEKSKKRLSEGNLLRKKVEPPHGGEVSNDSKLAPQRKKKRNPGGSSASWGTRHSKRQENRAGREKGASWPQGSENHKVPLTIAALPRCDKSPRVGKNTVE